MPLFGQSLDYMAKDTYVEEAQYRDDMYAAGIAGDYKTVNKMLDEIVPRYVAVEFLERAIELAAVEDHPAFLKSLLEYQPIVPTEEERCKYGAFEEYIESALKRLHTSYLASVYRSAVDDNSSSEVLKLLLDKFKSSQESLDTALKTIFDDVASNGTSDRTREKAAKMLIQAGAHADLPDSNKIKGYKAERKKLDAKIGAIESFRKTVGMKM